MRIFVTGGAGFIGSHLVERLVDDGHHVDVIDDLSTGSLANLAGARSGRTKRLTIDQLDVRDPGLIDLMQRREPELVYHLAAHDDGSGGVDRAVLDTEVNLLGSVNVIEGARQSGARKVVFASSGSSIYRPASAAELPIREKHPQEPNRPHGVSKKAVADYLAVYREVHALEFTALVLADVYGPRQRHGVVARFVDQVSAGEACSVDGDGSQTRDFVYVDDVVDAFVRSADKGGGLTINVGTGDETSIDSLLAELEGVMGRKIERSPRPGVAGPERFALDPGRARIHLGWSPWTALANGLAETLGPDHN